MKKPTGKQQSSAHSESASGVSENEVFVSEATSTTRRLSELADQAMRKIGFDPSLLPAIPSPVLTKRPAVGHRVSNGVASPSKRRSHLEEVRRKITEGYYDNPEIRQKIVDRLADTLKQEREDGE